MCWKGAAAETSLPFITTVNALPGREERKTDLQPPYPSCGKECDETEKTRIHSLPNIAGVNVTVGKSALEASSLLSMGD